MADGVRTGKQRPIPEKRPRNASSVRASRLNISHSHCRPHSHRLARPKRARKRATRKKKLTFEARRRDRRRRLRGSTRRRNKVDEVKQRNASPAHLRKNFFAQSEDAATSSGSDTIPIDLEESNLDAHEAEGTRARDAKKIFPHASI